MVRYLVFFKRFTLLTSDCPPCKNFEKAGMWSKSFLIPFWKSSLSSFSEKSSFSLKYRSFRPPKRFARRPKHRKSRPVAQFAKSTSISPIPIAKLFVLLPLARHFVVSPFRVKFQYDWFPPRNCRDQALCLRNLSHPLSQFSFPNRSLYFTHIYPPRIFPAPPWKYSIKKNTPWN